MMACHRRAGHTGIYFISEYFSDKIHSGRQALPGFPTTAIGERMNLNSCMLPALLVALSGCSFAQDLAEHDPVRVRVLAELSAVEGEAASACAPVSPAPRIGHPAAIPDD